MGRSIGNCIDCGKQRPNVGAGRCAACHAYYTWQKREPRPCSRCGRVGPPFAAKTVLCKSCYQVLRRSPEAALGGSPEHRRRAAHPGLRRERSGKWRGGRFVDSEGYVRVLPPSDYAGQLAKHGPAGYVHEHRLIAEAVIGRPLRPGEVVHHLNHDRTDNRPENLAVLASLSEHQRLHAAERRRDQTPKSHPHTDPTATPGR